MKISYRIPLFIGSFAGIIVAGQNYLYSNADWFEELNSEISCITVANINNQLILSQKTEKKDEPQKSPRGDRGNRYEQMLENITKRLELDEKQQLKIKDIYDKLQKRIEEIREQGMGQEVRDDMREAMENADKEINKILTDKQKKEFEKFKEERKSRREKREGRQRRRE